MTSIFIDGRFIGETNEPEKIVRRIRERRRLGLLSDQINVAYHKHLDTVNIFTDSGRVRRPLIIVEEGKPRLTAEHIEKLKKGEWEWEDLLKNGIIEYLDAEEEENAYIALNEKDLTKEHTHLEIHPSLILGFSASHLPFVEFNRGDRVNYGAKMHGQAIGLYSTNFLARTDTKSNVLIYLQKPITQTPAHKVTKHEEHPHGINVIVLLSTFLGYNMWDAVVMSKAAIERGLFWSIMCRTYEAEQRRYMGGQEDLIGIPKPGVRGYAGEDAYKHLPEDGIVNPETFVDSDSILIGRISPLRFLGTMDQFITGVENIRETSVRLRHGDEGIVDRVFITETTDGTKLVKVVVRDLKVPEIGDKFATRHGQKGVIGLIANAEDLPFNEDGIVPDIIFNPHSIPSRMTMGQLLEIISGKLGALNGEIIYYVPFESFQEKELRKKLAEFGYNDDGTEITYDGRTGAKQQSMFMGSCFYEKLDHLVSNKIHARSRGPVTLLTKQPTEGRSKEGGLRLGEMEKDCLIAHGAALVLKERFDSDKTSIPFCVECGLLAIYDKLKNRHYCPICGGTRVAIVEMSYAFKLMLEELKSMLIYPKLMIKEDEMKVEKIVFKVLSPEIIKKLSAAKITKPELYDQEGYPIEGGVMDPRLGVIDPGVRCRTCGGMMGDCHGHFGHVELVRPVLHVLYIKVILTLLKAFCRGCGRILLDEKTIERAKEKKISFKDLVKSIKKKCQFCKTEQKKLKLIKPYTIVEDEKILNPIEIRERLEKIKDDELRLLRLKGFRPEWLVITLLPIPPVNVRPSITLETGERSEDDLTHKLVEIVRINDRLGENIELGAPDFIIEDLWELLQYQVATYFDNELTGVPPSRHRSGRILKTLSQRLKTKEGRFRGNLAGKRVNFSARTVISPDPLIDLDEVGVPEVIAKELTIPIVVNEKNLEILKSLVLNGPNVWPGANYVIRPDGRRKKITEENKEEIANEIVPGYIVERHLLNNDLALFNRQPSLHRMSIMTHRVKVMPFKTFRLNLCTCIPYNADFDGDEMNLHIPQTEEARAEAEILMAVEKHMRSPRFSGPIIGSVHDFITGLFLLTKGEKKFSREEYVHLVRSIDTEIELPDKDFLTGKEIFSLFLPKSLNIEFKTKAYIGCKKCNKEKCEHIMKADSYVIIKNGKLIAGAIDKVAVGAEAGKLIDKLEKEYGSEYVKNFLYKITMLGIEFLTKYGFSISISDQDLPENVLKQISQLVEKSKKEIYDLVSQYEKGELKIMIGRSMKETLETLIKRKLNSLLTEIEKVVSENFKFNNTLAMALSGARGGLVNFIQTSAIVGQEMIMGERIEKGYYGRTFPHFKPFDISLESKGFVPHSFKDGLTVFEFFFDAMNSREGLMDKSLRTRHSGYMERRLVGALQDLRVEYDLSVRDSGKRIIQFLVFEDALNPAKIRKGGLCAEEIASRIFGIAESS